MNVNTNIYGIESTWTPMVLNTDTDLSISENANIYVANFGGDQTRFTSRLVRGYTNGRLVINTPIDRSIATVGVDDNCILLNQSFINVPVYNTDNRDVEFTDFDVLCSMQKTGNNALCYFKNQSTLKSNGYPLNSNTYYRYYSGYNQTLQGEDNTFSTYANVAPVTKMPVSNMAWVIMVKCSNNNPKTTRILNLMMFDLYTYINSDYTLNNVVKKTYEHYPYIVNISIMPIFRNKRAFDNENNNTTTIFRRTDTAFNVYYPGIMNSYSPFTNPFNTDDEPYQILTYYQPSASVEIVTSVYYNAFQTSNGITSYGANCGIPIIIGTHEGNYSFNANYKYQFTGIEKLNVRIWNDSNIIRCNIWTEISNFGGLDGFYNFCMQQVAYLGAFFSDSIDVAIHVKEWNIAHTFIGTIDNSGITHGFYTEGVDNESQKQYEWTDFTDSPYNPENSRPTGEDKEVASDPYNFNRNYFGFGFQTGNYYALTKSELDSLKEWINKTTNPDGNFSVSGNGDNVYSYEELSQEMRKLFNGQYPEDMLLNLIYYPFDILSNLNGVEITPNANIKLGTVTTVAKPWFDSQLPDVNGMKLNGGKQFFEFKTPSYDIKEYFGDFRDYPPYTSMQLTVPYHSTIPIDVGMLYGHSIYVHIFCDAITGASTAFIMRDNGIPIATLDGQMGVPQMLIARNVGQYISDLTTNAQDMNQLKINNYSTALNAVASGAVAVAGFATAPFEPTSITTGIAGLAGLAKQIPEAYKNDKLIENKQIDLKHLQAGSTVVSQNAPSVSMVSDTNVRLIIHRPKLLPSYNASEYANTVGFACMESGAIGSFSGYSVFSGADLQGISAPKNEKNMIYSLLQSGVYI